MKTSKTNRKTKHGTGAELIVRVICLAVILVLTGRYAAAEELLTEGLPAEGQQAEGQTEKELQTGDPPSESPPAEETQTEDPPSEDLPAEEPQTEGPPAEEPPAKDPPAEEPPAEGSGGQPEKTEVEIVLRPVKEEGEPDPDLTEEIRNRIVSQIVDIEQDCLDRLCSCVSWEYDYSGGLMPPGTDRPAGESDIRLIFAEDPEYAFRGWTEISGKTDADPEQTEGEERLEEDSESERERLRSYLMTLPGKEPGEDIEGEGTKPEEPGEGTEPEGPEEGADPEGTGEGTGSDEPTGGTAEPETAGAETAENTETGTEGTEIAAADNAGAEASVPEPGPDLQEQSGTGVTDIPVQVIVPAGPVPAAVLSSETTAALSPEQAGLQNSPVLARDLSERGNRISARERSDTVPQKKAEAKTELRLIRTDQEREVDLTDRYQEILTAGDPEAIDWRTVLDPVPENDGMYTLRVKDTDTRGTVTTKDVTFSVNRFGSVYSYNRAIRTLRGKTVRNVKDPLVISEYNPDLLESGSWKLTVTHDGQPMDQVLYTVTRGTERKTEEETDHIPGTDGWYRYDYVIDPENFREDGVYRLTVSSRDAAGNRPEMNRYNGGDIVFTVDSTPPELQMAEGLEEPVVKGQSAEIRIRAFDAVGLAEAAVYANGTCLGEMTRFTDPHRAEMSVRVPEGEDQEIRVVLTDTAGNRLDTEEKNESGEYLFRPSFPFRRSISVIPEKGNAALKKELFALAAAILSCTGAAVWLYRKFFREEVPSSSDS